MNWNLIRNTWIVYTCLTLSLLSGCSTTVSKDGPPKRAIDVSTIPNAKPKYEPKSRYGNPTSYTVYGKRYHVLKTAKGYNKRGIASWYGTKFNGKLTSSREPYDMFKMTAASPELPIPSYVRVTNLENGRSIVVRVNDRGPFAPNRIIDLSWAAAKKLGYMRKGTAMVDVAAIDTRHPDLQAPPQLAHSPHLYLQVGAFSKYTHAEKLKIRLQQYTQKSVRISRGEYHNKPIYRVQIGPLKGVGESDALFNRLQHDGFYRAITVIG